MTDLPSRTVKRKLSITALTTTDSSSSSPQPPQPPQPPPPYSTHNNEGYSKANDEDLVSAAEALTQLTRCATPPVQTILTSNVASPLSTLSIQPNNTDNKQILDGDSMNVEHPLVTKVSRATKHPIVTNAVKYYENSKRNYGAFNYAAEMVEKAAIPVVNKIEVNLNSRHKARQIKLEEQTSLSASGLPQPKKRRLSTGSEYNRIVTMETKKRLQFCLNILRLANENINSKVNGLQQKVIDKERSIKEQRSQNNEEANKEKDEVHEPESPTDVSNVGAPADTHTEAQETKTEIVATVKKIIHVISNFRPSALNASPLTPTSSNSTSGSEDLVFKSTIRDIILRLPSTIQHAAITNNTSAQQANDRIFVFAKESLDMITKLTNVFHDQLEHADHWLAGEEKMASPIENESPLQEHDEKIVENDNDKENHPSS